MKIYTYEVTVVTTELYAPKELALLEETIADYLDFEHPAERASALLVDEDQIPD